MCYSGVALELGSTGVIDPKGISDAFDNDSVYALGTVGH